jgi:hypothetical protein
MVDLYDVGAGNITFRRRDGTEVFNAADRMWYVVETRKFAFRSGPSAPLTKRKLGWYFGTGQVQSSKARKVKDHPDPGSNVRLEFASNRGQRDIDLGAVKTKDPRPLLTGWLTVHGVVIDSIEGNAANPNYDRGVRAIEPKGYKVPLATSKVVAEYWTVAGDSLIWRTVGFDLLVERGKLILRQWAGQGKRNGPSTPPGSVTLSVGGDVKLDCSMEITISECSTTGRTV